MLFIQGSRDAFGTPAELRPIIKEVTASVEVFIVEGGDHSFKVSKRAEITQNDVYKACLTESNCGCGRLLRIDSGGQPCRSERGKGRKTAQ
jgi:predicted alpha/beta-hydrolase family hydrolase